jgi:hypothetical protein
MLLMMLEMKIRNKKKKNSRNNLSIKSWEKFKFLKKKKKKTMKYLLRCVSHRMKMKLKRKINFHKKIWMIDSLKPSISAS